MKKDDVKRKINELLSNTGSSIVKYYRNYMLYNQTNVADFKAMNPIAAGVLQNGYNNLLDYPSINVVKSAVDAVVSKISTAKPRPFVNTVKGSFKTIEIARQLQIFFDYYFNEQDAYNKNVEALRDACIFDRGCIYINEADGELKVVKPWYVFTSPSERGDKKQCYIQFEHSTIEDVPEKLRKYNVNDSLYMNYGYYYNSSLHIKATVVNNEVVEITNYESDHIPLLIINYTTPIASDHGLSISDMLVGVQKEINVLMQRITEASKKNPGMTIFLQNASNISVGELNNEIGNIVQYNSESGNNSPVNVMTPDFISGQYMVLLNDLIEKAYNLVGISQLSAQGKKTPGLDSGIALATQEDITSDRFQTLLNSFITLFTDEAYLITQIGMADETVLQPSRYELKLTWNDVREDYNKMRIEFSSADALSKDPSEKLKQLQALAQAGIIPATQIASLMELPDINRGFSAANNGFNAVMSVIDACIYDDNYEIPYYVPIQLVKEQIINMQLSLKAAEGATTDNEDDINKLSRLFEKCNELDEELTPEQEQANTQDVTNNNAFTQIADSYGNEEVPNRYDVDMSPNSNKAASN